ncbi:MAG: hypothetical protein EOP08_03520 [Proteobacteria bacterium]|nr:MAG: hypothetical protein EOP08_03520 [Pseudomonadota bacterium]
MGHRRRRRRVRDRVSARAHREVWRRADRDACGAGRRRRGDRRRRRRRKPRRAARGGPRGEKAAVKAATSLSGCRPRFRRT